jgi:uncharacterized protein with von Willebrand factor type A (vWA) domain
VWNSERPLLANLLHFTSLLRRVGVPVSLEQKMDFIRALDMIDIGKRDQVYHAARSLLVKRKEDFPIFDRIFERFWRLHVEQSESPQPQKTPVAPRHKLQKKSALSLATLMAQRARQNDPEVDLADRANSYSATEAFQDKAFSTMTPEELETVKRTIHAMRWKVSERQTRRRVLDRHGRYLAMRRVMRNSTRYGGVPLKLAWHNRKIKPRPLVVLADISGSMEKYSRLLLQFSYCVTDSLQAFNREWSRRVLRRGAIVLIISDGWERGDAESLRMAMHYLQHRCHRLIWLNPLLGNPAYEARVEGLMAAMPYIDDFLPIHNLQSLETLGDHLASLR